MKIMNFLATAFVTVLLLGGLWLWFMPTGLNKAPEISLPIIDGRTIDLQDLQGQPVLVTFWSTTCSGCLKEMPHLVELYEEYAPQGFEIIGIAMYYDPPNQVLKMSKHRQIPYPIALDIKGEAAQAFGNVRLTPTSFLIGPDGSIVHHKTGEMDIDKLREQIKQLLPQTTQIVNQKLNTTIQLLIFDTLGMKS